MKTEKLRCKLPGGVFPLWMAFLLVFAMACQQEEAYFDPAPDAVHSSMLKSNGMLPVNEYLGEYEGGLWQICLPGPAVWNTIETTLGIPRCMIFYAHGMVDPDEPLALPADSIGTLEKEAIRDIISGMGMGYAATSYRANGLVVLDAVKDIQKLTTVVQAFFRDHPQYLPPDFLILGGPSEGGMVTVKTIEKYPQLFDGAISMCGPIGSFYKQLQYNGDFHVLFNLLFKPELEFLGINLGNPQDGVHPAVMSAWKSEDPATSLQTVIGGILLNEFTLHPLPDPANRVVLLLKYAGVPVDYSNPYAMGEAVIGLLRFNIMLTNDVLEKMKGVPYNNMETVYSYEGSDPSMDYWVNSHVQRIADHSWIRARNFVMHYETDGQIATPLVIIHTTDDHITPYWHQELYGEKIFHRCDDLLTSIPVVNYGHCSFDRSHIETVLGLLLVQLGTPADKPGNPMALKH